MSRTVPIVTAWVRQHFTWSNTRQAWAERLGVLGAALAIVLGVLYVREAPPILQVLYWGITLSAAAFLSRRGWLKLFGPVLFYDLVCLARRLRYFLVRSGYAVFLLFLIGWIWFVHAVTERYDMSRIDSAAQFAGTIFEVFVSVQFALVTLLTPVYTASAIADEKERRTLEFLLATDLRNREIVLSKLLARYLNLGMLILAGLPILALLEFLGGVDPDLVFACYAATLATMASLAGLSTLFSVLLCRGRDAILMTYLCIIAYFTVRLLQNAIPNEWLPGPTANSGITLTDILGWYNAGNIFDAVNSVGYVRSNVQDTALWDVLRNYVLFHGILAVFCIVWAVMRLRAVALKETYGRTQKLRLFVRWFGRPRVGLNPMVWKEVHAEPGLRIHWFGRIIILLLVLGSFVPVFYFLDDYFSDTRGWRNNAGELLAEKMNYWGRIVGAMVGTLLLLGVAVRAAGSITGERDKQTFDSLLTSPLDSNHILFGKWVGSVLSMRRGWIWLGAIYLLMFVCGGVHILGLILAVGAWLVFAGVVALLGLWASTICRSTMRASVLTLILTVLGGGGHWILWMCCMPLLWGVREPEFLQYAIQFHLFALTPPVTLGELAFRGNELESERGSWNPVMHIGMALVGLLLWSGVAVVLWGLAANRLRNIALRTPTIEPEEAMPLPRRRPRLKEPNTGILTVEEVRKET
jgi:ABC-type transport system involved in multi-copper enzyme maturation permease subunit